MEELATSHNNSPMPIMVIEAKDLPSRGLGYPEGHQFRYRSYTFGEVKQNSATNDVELGQVVSTVMAGIESDDKFDKMKMSFIDMLYIGLLRRVSSQGQMQYQINHQCEKCNQVSTVVFSSSDLDFQDIKEAVKSLPLVVDLNGDEFHFMYPTVQNMLDIRANKKDKKTKGNIELEIVAATVVNMTYTDALAKLSVITDENEIESLSEIDSLLFHDIKAIKSVCKKMVEGENGLKETCKHTNYVSIGGKELLIRPFREDGRPDRNKIRFIGKQDS
jgi:hypothetical protein